MDQKHAMLYPPLEPSNNTLGRNERLSASAAIGLPTEAPPSYDVAMSSDPRGSGLPSTPDAAAPDNIVSAPTKPQMQPHSPSSGPEIIAAAVIVQQPSSHQQQPTGQSPLDVTPHAADKLGPNPCAVTCPNCGARETTRMCFTPNTRTHVVALLLCLVGWCCCACCVPYCMNSCRTGNHYCAQCNTFLGAFNAPSIRACK